MELTQEQIDAIIVGVLSKIESSVKNLVTKQIEDLEIPDSRNMASKKFVTDALEGFKTIVTQELTKTNEAVNKIATDTDVKIKELTTKKSSWTDIFKTVLDYED